MCSSFLKLTAAVLCNSSAVGSDIPKCGLSFSNDSLCDRNACCKKGLPLAPLCLEALILLFGAFAFLSASASSLSLYFSYLLIFSCTLTMPLWMTCALASWYSAKETGASRNSLAWLRQRVNYEPHAILLISRPSTVILFNKLGVPKSW